MSDSNNNSGGFAKTTDFKWLGVGIAIFFLIGCNSKQNERVSEATVMN